MKPRLSSSLVATCALWLLALSAHAGGTVTALTEANLRAAMAGGGNVTFAVDGTITLASTLVVTQNMVLDASGRSVILDGGHAVRVFRVASGVHLSLANLTIANGRHAGSNAVASVSATPGFGGGLLNDGGNVDLLGCLFLGNEAMGGNGNSDNNTAQPAEAFGGAIWNNGGTLSATNTFFFSNSARGGDGGGIFPTSPELPGGAARGGAVAVTGGSTTFIGCAFTNNHADGGLGTTYGPLGGHYQSGDAFGGALCNRTGLVSLVSCQFAGNTVTTPSTGPSRPGLVGGGAVCHEASTMDIADCQFGNNRAVGGTNQSITLLTPGGDARGGGVYNQAELTLSRCQFTSNQAEGGEGGSASASGNGDGGAVNNLGTCTVSECTFATNRADAGAWSAVSILGPSVSRGGAVYNNGSFSLLASALVGNVSLGAIESTGAGFSGSGGPGFGGALFNSGTCLISNTTFAANEARGGDGTVRSSGGTAYGGALHNAEGTSRLVFTTISGNSTMGGENGSAAPVHVVTTQGGGISRSNGNVVLQDTIVANNAPGGNAWGTLTDLGHNLSSDASCGFTNTGSLNNADPKLGALADNGGPTLTMAPLTGSPAIDAGIAVPGITTDQRGFARPFGSAPDIGAIEFGAVPPSVGFRLGTLAQLNGTWQLQLLGPPSALVRLQVSTNLSTWNDVATYTMSIEGSLLLPLPSSTAPQHFYRTVSP